MTPEQLTELRNLCNKATPGPWAWNFIGDCHNYVAVPSEPGSNPWVIGVEEPNRDANAKFIVASRTAIPELLDEVERLRTRLFELNDDDWLNP